MNRVIAVVEGATEQSFIRQVLGPWLRGRGGVDLAASRAGAPGSKGGNSYDRAKRDILKHLKNPHFSHVTTFFDYYGLSQKWPGKKGVRKKVHRDQPKLLEEAIRNDFETPEDINDSAATAPSKRIEEIYRFFRKNIHGVIAAERITIDVMIGECPHFRNWVETLQAIGSKEGQ